MLLVAVPAAAPTRAGTGGGIEVIVTLKAPPAAAVGAARRAAYARRLDTEQAVVIRRVVHAIPRSRVRWRYHSVLDGFSVLVPKADLRRLASIDGVARVWPNGVYHTQLDRTPGLIGATKLWGPTLATAGQGMKIAIIDEGIDQNHPFFDPTGFAYPSGFPKGNISFTTPKVIVARVFPPPGAHDALETLPFVGRDSQDDHGTIVAGIAAGDANTNAKGVRVSGIAPRAYLGNYKALSATTPGVGLDGNAPELAAAIEAAVNDGMNVINMSLGEPEVDPRRDPVVKALEGAAAMGVVPVVAAGNDFDDFGNGSITSPANAPSAIAVAAATGGHGSPTPDRIASWSSGGPTPYSFLMKPDVTAPGVGVLSSVPPNEGLWQTDSGTSLAAPHVAGAAALLMQRHPDWTVADIKSAFVTTGVPVRDSAGHEVPTTREGGGRISLTAADDPGVFVDPTSLSFGLLRPGSSASRTIAVTTSDHWSVGISLQGTSQGISFGVPASLDGSTQLNVAVHVAETATARDVTGFVVLRAAIVTRRIPFWFRVERPRLQLDQARALVRAGVYRGTTVGAGSHVSTYRYPDLNPTSFTIPTRLAGPEAVYRFRLRRPVANFGVAVLSRARGVAVTPRIVRGADENRLAGYTALPVDLNPYRITLETPRAVAGVVLPEPDTYEIVFDSPRHARRGSFTFRFWINDTKPPTMRVLSRTSTQIRIAVRDAGAGVDPVSLTARIDGHARNVVYANGIARISLPRRTHGRHALVFSASDYQETKNMEDVGPILPNTRTLKTTIVVR